MKNEQPTQEIELAVLGMTCDACARHVTHALQGVEGVVQVEVPGWTSRRAILSAQPGVDEAQLLRRRALDPASARRLWLASDQRTS